jgi:hypothetical protein
MNWNPIWLDTSFAYNNAVYLAAVLCILAATCDHFIGVRTRLKLVCFGWFGTALCYLWRLQYIIPMWPRNGDDLLVTCMVRTFLQLFVPPAAVTIFILAWEGSSRARLGTGKSWATALYWSALVILFALGLWFVRDMLTNCTSYPPDTLESGVMPDT